MPEYHEALTLDGKTVSFQIDPATADADEIKKAIGKIERADIRATKTSISHGACGMYSRYDIVQYDYAGGNDDGCGGYIEVLHVRDAPAGRAKFILNEYQYPETGHVWSEWKTLEDARIARRSPQHHGDKKFAKLPGLIRVVSAGALCPWFFAVGDELIIGDFAVGSGMEDDSAFRIGTKWVSDKFGYPEIKTCLGCRFFDETEEDISDGSKRRKRSRIVYWSDGTSEEVDECGEMSSFPRPLCEDELWVEDAMRRFRMILAGKGTSVSIPFLDGTKFVGKYLPRKEQQDPAGQYSVTVVFKDGKKASGTLDFHPNEKCLTVADHTKKYLVKKGNEKPIARISIESCELQPKGKKWKGIFYERTKESRSEAK